ncbi:MAG: hypothetical protein ACPGUD_11650 [Parashewanella sp.]
MLWIVTAVLIGTITFIWTPQTESSINTIDPLTKLSANLSYILVSLTLVGGIICCLAIYDSATPTSFAALGFTLTSACIATPKLHRFILPSAIATAVLLLSIVIN